MNIKSCARQTLAALTLSTLALTGSAETVIVEQVTAVVEDDIILASELLERMEQITASLSAQNVPVPERDILAKQALDRLIEESIQLRMGRRYGVRVLDAQLNTALNRIAAQNQLSLEQFRSALEQEGKSYEDMRDQLRRDMIVQRVQQGNVSQRVQITDQEIDTFLASEEGRQLIEEEYHIVHALLPLAEDSSPAQTERAKQYIDSIHKKIKLGESFEKLISSNNEYTFNGGDLGWRRRGSLPSLFADTAPQLEIGQTAEPIQSPSGFHLIKLLEKRGGQTIIPQAHIRHILVKPSAIRSGEQTQELATQLRERALAGEDFSELAREYSEDIGSAQEGGDLDWVSPGQMVPEFERVMDVTEPGAISMPFTSQFGWHVLQVVDRRKEDVTDTVLRNMAANHLHQRKYQDELQLWLQKIRDEAFVDIK